LCSFFSNQWQFNGDPGSDFVMSAGGNPRARAARKLLNKKQGENELLALSIRRNVELIIFREPELFGLAWSLAAALFPAVALFAVVHRAILSCRFAALLFGRKSARAHHGGEDQP
jgi:hypothetical protein